MSMSDNPSPDEKSDFYRELLSLASHQLRSPLAAVKGRLSLIADGTYGPVDPRAKEALEKAEYSVDELVDLIDHFLDLRQIEKGKMEYRFEKIELVGLVRSVADYALPLAEGRGLELTLETGAHEVWVSADAPKLKQAIHNLVDNSIKYTPSGSIIIGVGSDGEWALITVADTGIGIPAGVLPGIFEEFARDERIKKEIRGTGLGLYITKKFVDAHGGKVWAESKGEGKGSTFSVRLPLAK